MSAAAVALGDEPSAPFVDSEYADCPEASPTGRYLCTGRKGHTRGDIPHVAYGITSGALAIWDDAGREVDIEVHGIGATLSAAVPS